MRLHLLLGQQVLITKCPPGSVSTKYLQIPLFPGLFIAVLDLVTMM